MRILVTGANGFVGPFVVRQLLDKHEVMGVDVLRYGKPRFSEKELSRFKLDTSDLRDKAAVERILKEFKPEAIIHLAAIHFIPECENFPDLAVTTNVLSTVNLLSYCPKACRFVFASTAAVYAPNDNPHREDKDTLKPMDVYGFTKLSGEEFTRYYSEKSGFPAVIVRLFNVVGPGETNPHLLPDILKQLNAGKRDLHLGNVHPKRDYIYVEDVARGFIAAATAPFPSGQKVVTANLGSGKSYSVSEIVERLSKILKDEIRIHVDPAKVRPVDRPNLCSDNSRFQSLFPWKPTMTIEQSLESTWHNPDMIEALSR